MVKLDDLRLDQLKKELEKVNLPTAGSKAELQRRLRDELQNRGIDVMTYEFESKEEMEVMTRSLEINSMFAAMMEVIGKMKINNKERIAEIEMKFLETAKVNSQKMLDVLGTELQETAKINSEKLLDKIKGKLNEISGSTNKQLQEISEKFNNRIDGVEKKFDQKLCDIGKKFGDIENDLRKKIGELEAKVNGMQQQSGPVRVVQETSSEVKVPSFDGSLSFIVFKFQFETVAEWNRWNNEQKAVELILALKGDAAKVLESVPFRSRKNFDDIMSALERKYGGEHKREIYLLELRKRIQKPNETLQDFALDIERLVELSYPSDKQNQAIDQFKIEAFLDGIRDPDIKFTVCGSPKPTFAETVSFALVQETAKIVANTQICMLQDGDAVDNNQSSTEHLMEATNRLLEKLKKPKSKCYNCGKEGNFLRDCRAPRRQLKFVSSTEGKFASANQRLQSNAFTKDHSKSQNHGNVDSPFKRPCYVKSKHYAGTDAMDSVIDVRQMQVESSKDWMVAQRSDPVLAKIMVAKEQAKKPTRYEILHESPMLKSYWALWDSLKMVDGCLYRIWESTDGMAVKDLVVVPSSKIKQVLKEFHGPSGGHLDTAKTLDKLRKQFYWVGCPQNVADWIANCPKCIKAKGPVRRNRGQPKQYNSGAPVEQKAMDVENKNAMVIDRMKARYDRATESNGFNEGQLVLLYNPQRRKGLSPKLQTHWDGPYMVVKRINDVVYRIREHKRPRAKMKIVHLERLAPYGRAEAMPIRDEQA